MNRADHLCGKIRMARIDDVHLVSIVPRHSHPADIGADAHKDVSRAAKDHVGAGGLAHHAPLAAASEVTVRKVGNPDL